jgi:hypothetical protein
MSFWDGVASFGLGAQGYNDFQNQLSDREWLDAKRKRDAEVAQINLEKLQREDALGQRTRQIAAQYGLGGPNQLPEVSRDMPVNPLTPVDDEGEPMPIGSKTVTLPAQANRSGMLDALAQTHEAAGDFENAAKIRQAGKAMETEGYADLLKGVASGEDPTTIAQRFNQKGSHRIVAGDKQGDAYSFTYEDGRTSTMDKQGAQDMGTRLGIFKKDITIVPHDATAIDASGNVVARGKETPKPDPFQLEEFRADLRDRTERLKASLQRKTEGKPREVALAEAFVSAGVASDMKEGLVMATEGKNLSPERFRANLIQRMASDSSDRLMNANPEQAAKARAELGRAADEVTKIAFPDRGRAPAAAPKPAGSFDVPDVQREIEAANVRDGTSGTATSAPPQRIGSATWTGQYTRSGKPLYRAADGSLLVGQ